MDAVTTRETILAANRYGLRNPDSLASWYTPTHQVAYDLGTRGIDLSMQPDVTGWRRGAAPASGLSHNYRDDRSERGLSLMALGDDVANGASEPWMSGRGRHDYRGLLLPTRGSDGEPLILAYGLDNLDA